MNIEEATEIIDDSTNESSDKRIKLSKAASILETNRCLSTEHEAALHFATSLLSHPAGLPNANSSTNTNSNGKQSLPRNNDRIPAGVKDAWLALLQNSHPGEVPNGGSNGTNMASEDFEYPLPKGQLAKSTKANALSTALSRSAEVAHKLHQKLPKDSLACIDALNPTQAIENQMETPDWMFQEFYEKVKDIREYHAKHPDQLVDADTPQKNYYVGQMDVEGMPSKVNALKNSVGSNVNHLHEHSKKRKLGNVIADGYDLHSILQQPLSKIRSGQMFSVEEVMGKYLDLNPCHQSFMNLCNTHSSKMEDEPKQRMSYPDFVILLASGLSTCKDLGEKDKLSQRKKYIRFLNELNGYLVDYLKRVSPLLDVQEEVVKPAVEAFEEEWSQRGGGDGWEWKSEEKILATLGKSNGLEKSTKLNLKAFESVEQLMEKVSAEQLKVELARFGMKCGGTPLDRAKRLWCTRDKPLEQLPAKLFTKKTTNKNGKKSMGVDGDESQYQGGNQRRIDIAKLEMIVSSMLGQLRPTLDATARRAERRLTQTTNEKEKEMEEEVNGAFDDAANKDGEGNSDSDDSDDEEAPIYNPKGVPLGWDGKPIAYWLFKLHGLNHFYPCEICGNESYRGRHNFEKHFAETKHAYGMKCLGMPNTMHFHGVTKIEDAQNLWQKLEENVNKDIFDGSKEEEYEDSQGNVLSRATYEDLARQGLL